MLRHTLFFPLLAGAFSIQPTSLHAIAPFGSEQRVTTTVTLYDAVLPLIAVKEGKPSTIKIKATLRPRVLSDAVTMQVDANGRWTLTIGNVILSADAIATGNELPRSITLSGNVTMQTGGGPISGRVCRVDLGATVTDVNVSSPSTYDLAQRPAISEFATVAEDLRNPTPERRRTHEPDAARAYPQAVNRSGEVGRF